jgi:hypothetical protein
MKSIICEMGGRAATGSAEAVPRCLSHLGKIRGGFAQDLVGLSKFTNLTLKLFDPRDLSAGRSRPFATITLGLTHPDAKAVRRTPQFACDRCQRRSFALILIAVFQRQSHRTLAELTFSCIFNALSGNG